MDIVGGFKPVTQVTEVAPKMIFRSITTGRTYQKLIPDIYRPTPPEHCVFVWCFKHGRLVAIDYEHTVEVLGNADEWIGLPSADLEALKRELEKLKKGNNRE